MKQTPLRDLSVELVPVDRLTPYAGNARAHSKAQIKQIAKSIQTFGWVNPIMADADGLIIAGHGRLEAAKLLGLETLPVLRIADLTEEQKRAYMLADNKIAENAAWDEGLLRIELAGLVAAELDFSIEDTGFTTGEIDVRLQGDDSEPEPEAIPVPDGSGIRTHVGDVWQLGRHRLICGDALDPATYDKLLEGEHADAVFSDPPFNVPVKGHVGGLGQIQHDEFVMASGEMSDEEFRQFLKTFCERIQAVCKPGAVAFLCMDWRHIADLIRAGEASFGELINVCVWNKNNGGMGSLYRSKHELFGVFRKAGAPHRNNVQLGKHGRNRTNVWDYPGVISRQADLKLHPTVKPTALVADAIKYVTARGELVLDPFAGSGSTLLAAEQTGRRAACAELDPKYVDLIIRRFEEATGEQAVHVGANLPFRVL